MRRDGNVDGNQTVVVAMYRRLGCTVTHTYQLGGGIPDIIVGCRGVVDCQVEIKDGRKPPNKQKLSTDEVEYHKEWQGRLVKIITSIEGVIDHVHELRADASLLQEARRNQT